MKKTFIIPLVLTALVLALVISCEPRPEFEEMTDPRDGQVYKTVAIGPRVWMAENLNYTTGNSWCYDDDPEACDMYGRLYDWETAMTACPPGWELPNNDHWEFRLVGYLGGEGVAGGKMKDTGTWQENTGLWWTPNTDATNESGFTGLPGGYSFSRRDRLISWGEHFFGEWWTATDSPTVPTIAWAWSLTFNSGSASRNISVDKTVGLSVRCIRKQ